jgi:UDP-N-acetylmuramate--alanine ligase
MILNRDDMPLWSLRHRVTAIAKKKSVTVVWYSKNDPSAKKIKKVISIPGVHNISNATAVYELGRFLEVPDRLTLAAIRNYHGAWRRMELRGKFKAAPVYDDYAHHPTEIAATLRAFKEKFPKKKILCVFQPHQTQRTALLFKEFQTAFDAADETLILPIYRVAGRDAVIPHRDSAALVRAIQKKQPRKPIFYLANPAKLKSAIVALGAPLSKKVIIMMGAGDIVKMTNGLVR